MERFYQDLSQAVKQVPKGNMLLVMGDFNAKGVKTVLLEVVRETIGSVKSQKKKKWISDATYAAIREREKQKAKTRNDIKI